MKRATLSVLMVVWIILSSGYIFAADFYVIPVKSQMGGFKLYDANDVFIGYIVDDNTVYNPDIPGFFDYYASNGRIRFVFEDRPRRSYTSSNCTGQAYLLSQTFNINYYHVQGETGYYITDTASPTVNETQIKSYWRETTLGGGCLSGPPFNGSLVLSPLKKIDFPFANTTLAFPLSIRND